MIRLGNKYQHLVHGAGCGCSSPLLENVSRRLEAVSRRYFLAGAGAGLVAAAMPAAALAEPPRKILFREVQLFDGTSGGLKPGAQVLVEGGSIVSVDMANNPPPSDADVLACGGRVLMPGLIDAHWHTLLAAVPISFLVSGDPGFFFAASTAEAERTLLRGFTTVRDLGGPVFSFKQAVDAGVIPGPRIYPSGAMITTSGGHGDLRALAEIPRNPTELSSIERIGGAMIADNGGEVNMRVREQLLQGASQIKIVGGGGVSSPRSPLDMSTFSEEDLRAAVAVASDWNTYATVHAYASHTVQRAIAAGAACIEHAHLMDEATAALMAEKGVWLSTQPFLSAEDTGPLTGPSEERSHQLFAGTPQIYEFAKKFGIKTAWGSDMLFSPELAHRQNVMLTHLSRWYSNADVLRAATSVNAELLALSGPRNPYPGKLGVIEKGAFADILVVDGNPLDDIGLMERPGETLSVVMKGGQTYKNTLPA